MLKKLFLLFILLFALVGCDNNFKYDSPKAKEKFLMKLMENNTDMKLQKEYRDILLDLQEKAQTNEEASKQLNEWQEAQLKISKEYLKKMNL
ncbi:hypothetical protein [Fusobacterium sp. FSA-380-WT-2B]|uniref:hypothetical protein n=1 Tax=Fusobacterium sp. FSA-380-WT-2B TaxID=2605786 RepID=UPI0012B2D44C|nr:hypothetical protein [Fusobacterium sp. FSA-380-WT-2B]MSS62122.1 hypothetical protein [Fusobacterium sp. FSA-380-WT-2B]